MADEIELTCPRCLATGVVGDGFTKYDNADQLHNLTIYRCTSCGHSHAPIPQVILPYYLEKVLGVKAL